MDNSIGLIAEYKSSKKKPKIDKVFKQKSVVKEEIPKNVLKLFGEKVKND